MTASFHSEGGGSLPLKKPLSRHMGSNERKKFACQPRGWYERRGRVLWGRITVDDEGLEGKREGIR